MITLFDRGIWLFPGMSQRNDGSNGLEKFLLFFSLLIRLTLTPPHPPTRLPLLLVLLVLPRLLLLLVV